MTTQPMLSDEQIEEIVYIVLNHGQVDAAVAEIREHLAALAPPVAPAGDREAVAWRYRQVRRRFRSGDWVYLEYKPVFRPGNEGKFEAEALYTAPAAQPAEERAVITAAMAVHNSSTFEADQEARAELERACEALSAAWPKEV